MSTLILEIEIDGQKRGVQLEQMPSSIKLRLLEIPTPEPIVKAEKVVL